MSLLPVEPVFRLAPQPIEQRWLIEGLWGEQAVGLIGGEPKCCKSLLALDLATAVASGTPCLRRFPVARPGRVLLFAAEDALHVVRLRFEGIARAAGIALEQLDVQVITAAHLRLDRDDDAQRLDNTVDALRPRLLILDPFVRLHRRDENASGDVAPLLAFLRELQRRYQVAVVVVHHAKKSSGNIRAGQALRGSSEFHAWGDAMLYLRRHGQRLTLTAEHRAAPGIDAIDLRLRTDDERLALEVIEPQRHSPADSETLPASERVLRVLATATSPLGLRQLLTTCQMRKATLCQQLNDLLRRGAIVKTEAGYSCPDRQS
jgi:hypothetical protein